MVRLYRPRAEILKSSWSEKVFDIAYDGLPAWLYPW
jgi:hypothetical protein